MRAPHDTPSRGVVRKICDFGCEGLPSIRSPGRIDALVRVVTALSCGTKWLASQWGVPMITVPTRGIAASRMVAEISERVAPWTREPRFPLPGLSLSVAPAGK
jgi:hypothetical protein